MKILYKTSIACCALLFLGALAACTRVDTDKTVTVVVTGVRNSAESEDIIAILKALYDKDASMQRMQTRFSNGELTIEMSPVSDIGAFVQQINFGTVTEVTERTIKVHFTSPGSTLRV